MFYVIFNESVIFHSENFFKENEKPARVEVYIIAMRQNKKRLTLNGLRMPCFTNETGCLRKEILKRVVDELNKW